LVVHGHIIQKISVKSARNKRFIIKLWWNLEDFIAVLFVLQLLRLESLIGILNDSIILSLTKLVVKMQINKILRDVLNLRLVYSFGKIGNAIFNVAMRNVVCTLLSVEFWFKLFLFKFIKHIMVLFKFNGIILINNRALLIPLITLLAIHTYCIFFIWK